MNAEERDILEGYAQAIRAAMTIKKKVEWDQGGVRAVEVCQEIQKSLEEAAASCPHPLLEAMHDMTKATDDLVDKVGQIKERQEEIRAIANIFKEPENLEKMSPDERNQIKDEKTSELVAKRDEFSRRSQKTGEDAKLARHFFRVTNGWLPHLFTFLDVPGMPSTNNGTEQKFGHIKTGLRRITGRHNNHELIYRHGDYVPLTGTKETLQELTDRISSVSYSEYRQERERIRKKIAPLNMRKRVQRKTKEYLQDLKNRWAKIHST